MGSAQVVTGLVGSSSSTIMGLAPLATKCFLLVVCVTLAEGSQRVRRWNACNACNGGGGGGRGGRGCGSGAQGSCCSSQDCPHEAPVCSEWGYCQCSSYQWQQQWLWRGLLEEEEICCGTNDCKISTN